MQRSRYAMTMGLLVYVSTMPASAPAADFDLSWHTIDGGGAVFAIGGAFELSGTIGQPDAGTVMTGGGFALTGGFWAGAAAGAPAATVVSAVSRRTNPHAPGVCDTDLLPARKSEPHQGGITEVHIAFDIAPGGGGSGVTLEHATCAAPTFASYSGASTSSAAVAGNELVLTFAPGLENGRTYRIRLGPAMTSIPGQSVEVRGLAGDANNDGTVNALDRSVVVGAWTGGGFSCPTDINGDGSTNATDRSLVVGVWTGPENCAP